jgi:recombination protein RecR
VSSLLQRKQIMSDPIARLSNALSKLPGIGEKTAARLTFFILKQPKEYASELAAALLEVKERVGFCSLCFDLSEGDPCRRCKDPHRDATHLCAVATPQDLLAIDRTGAFRGRYHVLGGVLSPLEGVGPNELKVRELIARLQDGVCKEMILATPPTVEGDATALYISKLVKPIGVKVTRLAMGLPVGGELEYADQVTLGRALEGRREL